MFVVNVIFQLFFRNRFLHCQTNEYPQILFQQISRSMEPVCYLVCVLLERFKNSNGRRMQTNYIQMVDAHYVIRIFRID